MSTRTERKLAHPIRRKIEALGPNLTLPIVRKAMGVIEGEHPSHRRGSGYEFLDLRQYVIGDEARLIDWKASARHGQPIVASHEQTATSNVWMFIDSGFEMNGSSPSGERQLDITLNAMRMFAMLSLKRGDNLDFVIGNEHSITRMPLSGGYRECDALLDQIENQELSSRRDWDSMIDYALKIHDKNCLLIFATSDSAWTQEAISQLGILALTHPVVVINVETFNPFISDTAAHHRNIFDGLSGRKIPSFMRNTVLENEVKTARRLRADQLTHMLNLKGATLFNTRSSEHMFSQFVHRISLAHKLAKFTVPAARSLTLDSDHESSDR